MIYSVNSVEEIDTFISQNIFFHHFLYVVDTRLARISEDIPVIYDSNGNDIGDETIKKKYLSGDVSQKILQTQVLGYEEQLYKIFYGIASFGDPQEYSESHIYNPDFKIYIEQHLDTSLYSNYIRDILFYPDRVCFDDVSTYLQLFFLTIHLSKIHEYIGKIHIDVSDRKQAFYYHMFQFVDTNFYNIDYKKSYHHLLEAEKLFPQLSQIYALKVRTLYFLGFNHYSISDQWNAREKLLHPNNPVFKRIQENIALSNKYNPQNKGIFIFELALYLHCKNWKGIVFFLKNYHRRKEFYHGQRVTIFLWVGKFFYRHGYYKQAKHYLYTEVGKGQYKLSLHKSRLILSIISSDTGLFQKELSYICDTRNYKVIKLYQVEKTIYSDGEKIYDNIFQDSSIIIPAKKKSGSEVTLENIDLLLLKKQEKDIWEEIFLFMPHNIGNI